MLCKKRKSKDIGESHPNIVIFCIVIYYFQKILDQSSCRPLERDGIPLNGIFMIIRFGWTVSSTIEPFVDHIMALPYSLNMYIYIYMYLYGVLWNWILGII